MQTNTFIVEKEEAWELLKPYAQDLYEVISGGFKDFAELQAHKPVFEGHTKALLLWEYILQRMKKLSLKYDGQIKLERKQRMYFLNIQNKIALRFKKFDDHFKSGNIVTKQVKAFRNRTFKFRKQYLYPVEIGWQVSELFSLTSLDFISPMGKTYLWRIPVRNEAVNYNEIFPLEEKETLQVVTLKTNSEDAQKAS